MNLKYAKLLNNEVIDIIETDNVEDLFPSNGFYYVEVTEDIPVGAIYSEGRFTLPLELAKVKKLEEVDKDTANKITGGFISSCTGSPVRYDSDEKTQLTMQGIALNAESIPKYYPHGIPVRGYEDGNDFKTVLMLTPEQLMQWMADLSLHIGQCKQEGWQKQEAVKNAKNAEELKGEVNG